MHKYVVALYFNPEKKNFVVARVKNLLVNFHN